MARHMYNFELFSKLKQSELYIQFDSMYQRQICKFEFAFYVHYFTVYFIERLIDHGILVCGQALSFLWWRVK